MAAWGGARGAHLAIASIRLAKCPVWPSCALLRSLKVITAHYRSLQQPLSPFCDSPDLNLAKHTRTRLLRPYSTPCSCSNPQQQTPWRWRQPAWRARPPSALPPRLLPLGPAPRFCLPASANPPAPTAPPRAPLLPGRRSTSCWRRPQATTRARPPAPSCARRLPTSAATTASSPPAKTLTASMRSCTITGCTRCGRTWRRRRSAPGLACRVRFLQAGPRVGAACTGVAVGAAGGCLLLAHRLHPPASALFGRSHPHPGCAGGGGGGHCGHAVQRDEAQGGWVGAGWLC